MRIVQIVFSPTGGTQRVADLITGAWGLPVTQFDLSDPAAGCTELQLDSQDLVLIAVPSFGGRVPALAIQRLGNISGGGAQLIRQLSDRIDRLQISVIPTLLGQGVRLFPARAREQKLRLTGVTHSNGIVELTYQPR